MLLAVAWTLYYLKKDAFHIKGVPYMILVTLSFAVCSASMHVLNKECVSLTAGPSTLTAIQMAMTVVITMAFNSREVMEADRKKLLRWCIVPVIYAAMLNSSLLGYQYLSLSLVTVFRNLSPLVTMMVEGAIMDAKDAPTVTPPVVGSLMMMVAGAVMFAHGQVESTKIGLCIVALNTLLAIGDRLLQRRLLVAECKDLPLSACMVLNNTLGMVPTLIMAFTMHEVQGYEAHRAHWTDPATLVLVALSGCMGMGIGFSGLMCQKVMTATSFQVLQNSSKLAVVVSGVYIFGDSMASPSCASGMALSLLGSLFYGFARAGEAPAAEALPEMADARLAERKGERVALLGSGFKPFLASMGGAWKHNNHPISTRGTTRSPEPCDGT
jgi:drug/metabolite transporter (DMT)-like permease